MNSWITNIVEQFGYFGIFIMIAVENIFPPIPSEVVLAFGGFMTTYSSLTIFWVIVVATFGSLMGAVFLYGLGSLMNMKRLENYVSRYGHILRIKEKDIHKSNAWFEKYGYWAVFFGRMIPLVRSLISIPAGMAKMNIWLFLFFTTIGTVIWNTILVFLGAKVGKSWGDIVFYFNEYSNIISFIIVAFVIILLSFSYIRKKTS